MKMNTKNYHVKNNSWLRSENERKSAWESLVSLFVIFINICLVAPPPHSRAQQRTNGIQTAQRSRDIVTWPARRHRAFGKPETEGKPPQVGADPLRKHSIIHTHRLSALNAFKFFRLNGGDNDKDMKSACCCCLWLNSKCNFCFSRTFSYFSMVVSRSAASSKDFVCFSAPTCRARWGAGAGGRSTENLYGGYSKALTIGLMADGSPKVDLLLANSPVNCDDTAADDDSSEGVSAVG